MKLIGYCIFNNMKLCNNNESGFQLEFKKKIYEQKESAEDAIKQMEKIYPSDEFEIHPIYIEK